MSELVDIKPISTTHYLKVTELTKEDLKVELDLSIVAPVTGFSPAYISRALGKRGKKVSLADVIRLLELDNFSETFIPRSRIPHFLLSYTQKNSEKVSLDSIDDYKLILGSVPDALGAIPDKSIQCVVTSTPYWGLRTYEGNYSVEWADGEKCMYGHESTPEGFVRHSVEILFNLQRVLKKEGSVWWNVMDSYNTRTQVRGSASETLRAMQGKDPRSWKEHSMRRYSAGHSFLKDGEQSLIPQRIAERASRIGYWTKSIITWKKIGSMPETVATRVTRELEHIIHLSLDRSPYFNKSIYNRLDKRLGGRNNGFEAEKITDVWSLATSSGGKGHGAQFPLSLPGRCIALSSKKGDLILDPFVGVGTAVAAARALDRKAIGIDMSKEYIETAENLLKNPDLRHKQIELL